MPEPSPLTHDTNKPALPIAYEPIDVQPRIEELGILNDEVMVEIAPERPCGTIRVRLAYAGRSTPILADDPRAE
jgi:hypothetical protein